MPGNVTARADRSVCFACVRQKVVKAEIRANGMRSRCHYCRETRACIPLHSLAARVDAVYCANVAPSTEDEFVGMSGDDPIISPVGMSPHDIISDMLGASDDLSADLLAHLSAGEGPFPGRGGEEPLYSADSVYQFQLPTGENHAVAWDRFVLSLKHESRFFRHGGIDVLTDLFRGIADLPYRGKKAPIREITPTSKERWVFRARRANSAQERLTMLRSPADELGPPPREKAVAGRMNATGIAAFYGAFDPVTCVSELRLGIGETAVCCKFEITRPVRVLDLTVLKNVRHGSTLFDPDHNAIAERLAFLHSFEAAISRPVHTGAEMEYLPTQVLAEFLAFEQNPAIDGVIYSSTQSPGGRPNLALFARAAGVAGRKGEPPARFREAWDANDYRIWDREGAQGDWAPAFRYFDYRPAAAAPEPCLRACADAMTVHQITAVRHEMTTTEVNPDPIIERDLPF